LIELISLPPQERTRRLAVLEESDPRLHAEVESLIAAYGSADGEPNRQEGAAVRRASKSKGRKRLRSGAALPAAELETIGPTPRTERPKAGLWKHQVPPDLLRRAANRLETVAAIIAVALTGYLIINAVMPASFGPELTPLPGATNLLLLGMLLLSIGVYFLGRSRLLPPERMLDVGLVYEVALAFIGAVAIQFFADELLMPSLGVSEVAVLILVFAVLVPNTPGRVLAAALVAASMDPIGDLLYGLRGGQTPTFGQMSLAYYANYLAAGIALLTAHQLTRLAREIGEARELGSYRLTKRLGRGGMGEVWKAEHQMLARPAAIKLIRPDRLMNLGEDRHMLLRRFEREAQTTALLKSPHTIELYDFGVTPEGSFYYVMELLDGVDMQTLVDRYGPVEPARAMHLLQQVCDSLAEAHESGLVHRDIKPANAYVCCYGRTTDFVKVLDFGLVGPRAGLDSQTLIDAQTALTLDVTPGGTPAFMAPEQILGNQAIGARTDLYAVGCLAYWLLTGERVFEGTTLMEALVKHAREEPEPPSARSEVAFPSELDSVILECLEKDPERRPENAEVLGARFANCVSDGSWTADDAREWWSLHQPTGSPSNGSEA
jgi:serine/threonine-protein kinase